MEEAFKEFIEENWPGFTHPEAFFDFDRACEFENIKQAFKAGWEAKEATITPPEVQGDVFNGYVP